MDNSSKSFAGANFWFLDELIFASSWYLRKHRDRGTNEIRYFLTENATCKHHGRHLELNGTAPTLRDAISEHNLELI